MERRKLTKEDIDKVRDIEGFPIGSDEDIIALSDAPYYTACPNPFIEEFIRENGTPYDEATDDYHREPFAADVSEGKKDPIYNAHNYHTKVPHKAIMRYILHYTNPGDIVFDGFCGTGMTGVAAQMCGSDDRVLKAMLLQEVNNANWGTRKAVISDLSPVASFIASNYNHTISPFIYSNKAFEILNSFNEKYGWMYETQIGDTATLFGEEKRYAHINYTVWSDVFVCPSCSMEFVFSNVAVNDDGSVKKDFTCPHCNASLTKRAVSRAKEYIYDSVLNKTVEVTKQVPVLINYKEGKNNKNKTPSIEDLDLIKKIEEMQIPFDVPVIRFPIGDKTIEPIRMGCEYLHQIYRKRNLIAISYLYNEINKIDDIPLQAKVRFTFEQLLWGMSKLARYVPTHYSQVNQYLNGTLFIGSQVVETSPSYILDNKIKNLTKVFNITNNFTKNVIISTNSLTQSPCPNDSIDYIFTDPPFGDNLMYSELNFIIEAWNTVLTNNKSEAIINNTQKKVLLDYQEIMTRSFEECYRILKPNRWMTVEFHNSKNSIWNAIQESLHRAGFIIADVRTIDKKQGSFNQVNASFQAIKQDLIISAYKPKDSFVREFTEGLGTSETAWTFVRQHLSNLPIVVDADKNGKLDVVTERQAFLLWDRMVAYHIMNGIAIPLDATDFYAGLDERFLKRDGMYFLPDQVNEYDLARSTCEVENIQFSMFISDEKSAIAWLYQQLDENSGEGRQTYQVLMPKFMQEIKAMDKREKMPELMEILEENFLKDDEGRWYIPDLTKSGDIAKLREKNLLKEFQTYLESKGKLKVFRSEAIRAGFAKLWKEKNYEAIVEMAERLPEQTIQEDPNLLMYYDISLSRV